MSRFLSLIAALALALSPAVPAAAQSTVRVELGGTGSASQSLALPRGKSAVIELPVDARDVLVSNPAVADAVLRTPRRIYVLGVAPGQTDAIFFDGAGRQILSLDIRVDQGVGALEDTLRRIAPDANVHIEPVNDGIILSGDVATVAESERIQRIAERFVAKPELVLNMLGIRGVDQVMLKVRIVEMQRSVIKQMGFNTQAVLNQIGEPQYMLGSAASFGVNGGILGGFSGGYNLNTTRQPWAKVVGPDGRATDAEIIDRNYALSGVKDTAGDPGLNQAQAMIQAFERVGLVRTLAEPNLTAISGESAKFLAGGEFPVPTGRDQDGSITVTFKPFGVGLSFTPVVLSGGRISLKINTEVSELTNNGAYTIGTGANALTIPALNVRRADTTVEMQSGGALMIAGLLQEKTAQNIDSLPGMMNVPILGSLFRSRDYLSGETELMVIVTPYLVTPTTPDRLQTPVDGLQIANDMSTVLLGRLNRATGGRETAAAAGQPAWQGPIGYVIE